MRLAARVALWSLIVIAAIHGFVPPLVPAERPRGTATSTGPRPDDRRATDAPAVLTGPSALEFAIAGDPRNPFPKSATRMVGTDTLASVVNGGVASATARVGVAASTFGEFIPVPVDNRSGPITEGYHPQSEVAASKSKLW